MRQTIDTVFEGNVSAQVDMLRQDLARISECAREHGYFSWVNYEDRVPDVRTAFEAVAAPSSPLSTAGVSILLKHVAIYSVHPEPGHGDKRLFVDVEMQYSPARFSAGIRSYTLKVYPFHAFHHDQPKLLEHIAVERPDPYMTLPWRVTLSPEAALNTLIHAIEQVL